MGHRRELGGRAVSRMRELLAEQIAGKVRRHGLVIWEDSAGEYADVASSLVPQDTAFAAFDGSWYELRRRIEASVSGESPPKLVVYAPAPTEPDPLAEMRDAGTKFTRKLATLVEQAHRGRLPPARIATIGKQARTILEAEAAAESVGEADVRLIGSARQLPTRSRCSWQCSPARPMSASTGKAFGPKLARPGSGDRGCSK